MTLLSFLMWCAVASFSIEGRADLMGFLITIVLTIVAEQFAINSSLPPSPIPSFADCAMLSGSVFCSSLTIIAALLPEDEDTGNLVHQSKVQTYSTAVLIVIHLIFFAWSGYAFRISTPHNEDMDESPAICSFMKDNNPNEKQRQLMIEFGVNQEKACEALMARGDDLELAKALLKAEQEKN